MQNLSRRTLASCVLLLGATASFAAAAKALPCADYVSTGRDSEPGAGHLIGTSTMTVEVNGSGSFAPGGVGASAGGRISETYEVGYYDFGGGVTLAIDCRNYTLV